MDRLIALLAGLLFGTGLLLSGMTDPNNILAFLDIAGPKWSPQLALVMGGALLVTLPAFWYARTRGRTLIGAQALTLPDRRQITPRLVGGATLFGLGWGLSGVCPGPGLLLATTAQPGALVFLAGLLIGMALFALWSHRSTRAGSEALLSGGA